MHGGEGKGVYEPCKRSSQMYINLKKKKLSPKAYLVYKPT